MKVLQIAFLIIVLIAGSAFGRTWRVEQDGTGEFVTIQPAINVAADGDTISIGAGLYQETNDYYVPEFSKTVSATAYWNDGRTLSIIGAGRGLVVIGPDTFDLHGPLGVLAINSSATVRKMSFERCSTAIFVMGNGFIDSCSFAGSYHGVTLFGAVDGVVQNSIFMDDYGSGNGVDVEGSMGTTINHCEFDNAGIYIGNSTDFVVANSLFSRLGTLFVPGSSGEVLDCEFDSGGVSVSSGGQIVIRDSEFLGGDYNLHLEGAFTRAELHGNIFVGGAYYGLLLRTYASVVGDSNHILQGDAPYSVKVDGYGPTWPYTLDLRNNYWGAVDSTEIEAMIYDANDTPTTPAVVLFQPFSTDPLPVEGQQKSFGDLKSMFRRK